MPAEFQIMPLSDGIGLGKTRKVPKKQASVATNVTPPAERDVMIPKPAMARSTSLAMPQIAVATQQGRNVYRQQSIGSVIQRRPKTRVLVAVVRSLLGWGLDIAIVSISLIVCLCFGVLAWRVGSGVPDAKDPIALLAIFAGWVVKYGVKGMIGAFVGAGCFYLLAMHLLVGGTIGSRLRQ